MTEGCLAFFQNWSKVKSNCLQLGSRELFKNFVTHHHLLNWIKESLLALCGFVNRREIRMDNERREGEVFFRRKSK